MHHAVCAALLALVAGTVAAPATLGDANVELTNAWGHTLAEATAEAQLYSGTCKSPGSSCRPLALSPSELVSALDACSGGVPTLGWRRADELKGAERFAAGLRRDAAARALLDCRGPTCLTVLPTTTPREKEQGVSTLSVCSVKLVVGMPGPPSRCQEALKQNARSGLLIRGQVGQPFNSCSMGLRDFDAVFKNRGADVASVRKLVGEVLRAKPFNLTVMEDRNALVGIRAHLPSDVMIGWREWVTVRVEIDTRGTDAGTTIYTTMLVSKQASANREAWTPPSEPQEGAYLRALRDELQRRGGVLVAGIGQ
jgi:hypothetical protein